MDTRTKKRLWGRWRLFVGLYLLLAALGAMAVPKCTVYFYSAETNINNFRSLKIEFDTYLSNWGTYQFQPFSDRETFEQFIADKNDGVFLLSSWHYRSLKHMLLIEPVLVGVSEGRSTQKRVLSASKQISNLDLLEGGTVASSGSEAYARNVLMQMLGPEKEALVASLRILMVPKDIDALMALGFDMAEAALTTERSLTKLASLNPVQYGRLRQLAVSKEILLPIVAVPKPSEAKIRAFLNVIEGMGVEPEGEHRLRMLGLDGWRQLRLSEREMLEK